MASSSIAEVIETFDGPFHFLSNFSERPVEFDGRVYPTSEHAFAAAKTTDPDRIKRIAAAATPREAKRLGRWVPLRPNWKIVRIAAMRAVLRAKFSGDPILRQQLLDTGDALLIEGNTWGDDFWGRCRTRGVRTPVGANMLGRQLMALRDELAEHPPTRWPRVALTGHRPQFIAPDARDWARSELDRIAVKLRDEHDTRIASTGLAIGADLWWAQSASAAGLDLWGYQPFPQQNSRWNTLLQAEHAQICEQLSRHVMVGDDNHDVDRYLDLRNQLLIGDASAVVCVYDPRRTSGGTASALRRYCPGMPVITVNLARRTTTIAASYSPPQ